MTPTAPLLALLASIGSQDSRASAPEVRETVRGDLGRDLDEILARLARLGFCGVALVAKGGEVLLAKGYGASDREKGTPVTLDTVFCLGSVTKQFTGAAILKLEVEGKLAVSDPISKHLPGVPPDKAGITLHHLLTHSSGLRSDFAGDYDPVGREEYVRRALASNLLFAPGTRYAYSNAGYSLLGAIVELRSGKSYERYVHDALFEPAGMNRTGYKIPAYRPGEIAIGYQGGVRWGPVLERSMAEDGPWWALRATGGAHTTVGDFWRWHRALQGNSILPEAARARLFTPHVAEDPEGSSHYGYGWVVVRTSAGKKVVTHSGGNGIFSADFRHFVDDDVAIFLASSISEMPANALARIWRPVFGEKLEVPPRAVDLDEPAIARLAGSYRLPSGGTVRVSARGNSLLLEGAEPDAMAALLGAEGPDGAHRDLVARVEGIVRSAASGDFAPLHAAVQPGVPLEEFRKEKAATWSRWREELGPFRSVKAFARPGRGDVVRSFARLDFERGQRFLDYEWDGEDLTAIRMRSEAPRREVFPESPASFFSFEVPRWEAWKVRFEFDPYGAPARLVLPGAGGEVAALRAP